MNVQKKRKTIDPEACGLWPGCNDVWYTSKGRCLECGKTRIEHISADAPVAKPKRVAVKPLDKETPNTSVMFRTAGQIRVVITRYYRGAPLDGDNLAGACKSLRDEITRKVLGLSDDRESDTLKWEYRQAKGRGVVVEIFVDKQKGLLENENYQR